MASPSLLRPTARFVTKIEEELIAAADILVVSLVMRAGASSVRLRVHRRVAIGSKRSTRSPSRWGSGKVKR